MKEVKTALSNNENRKTHHVAFVSSILVESTLSDIYLYVHLLLVDRYFKFYFLKENRVYLFICFPWVIWETQKV